MNAAQFSSALGKVNDKYIVEAITYERKKKNSWLKWGAMAACFGLFLTAAMITVPGILKGSGSIVRPPAPDMPGPAVSNNDEPSSTNPLQPPDEKRDTINWDGVIVNEADMAPNAARRPYDPNLYTEETLKEEEIVAYYGWNLLPGYIPEGLTDGGNSPWGFMVRENANGEIVEEQAGRGFWVDFGEDGSPKSDDNIVVAIGFTVKASRLGIPNCCILPVDDAKTTDFGGVPVILSHCSLPYGPFDPTQKDPSGLCNLPAGYYDVYVASFTLDGVEYEIQADRLELEDLVKIVASIINMPYSEAFTVGNTL